VEADRCAYPPPPPHLAWRFNPEDLYLVLHLCLELSGLPNGHECYLLR